VTYIDSRGSRITTESAYLTPAVLTRPNLTIAVNVSATRIIFDTAGPSPCAVGVEFASSRDGSRFRVRAKQEVILAYVGFDGICICVRSHLFPERVPSIRLMLVFRVRVLFYEHKVDVV
jgi:GMC oxidoreductase